MYFRLGRIGLLFLVLLTTCHWPVLAGNGPDPWHLRSGEASRADFLSAGEREMIYYINLVRSDPGRFKREYLEPYVNWLRKHDLIKYKSDLPYIESLRRDLDSILPMGLLIPNRVLTIMARDHAVYSGDAGLTGHKGQNNISFSRRADLYVPYASIISENCVYGYSDVFEAFMALLVDAGVETLGHRKNILNPRFTMAGVGWSAHRKYKVNCVIDFSGRWMKV